MKFYLPHFTFSGVFFVAALPVLYYIWRKNPDPRFRPHAGEMALLTLIALFICSTMGFGIGSLFKPENDGTALKRRPDIDLAPAKDPDEDADRSSGKTKSRDRTGSDGSRRSSDKN